MRSKTEKANQQGLNAAMNKKPPERSRYDELHDKYHTILTTKAGTRYERLAAINGHPIQKLASSSTKQSSHDMHVNWLRRPSLERPGGA